MVENEEWNELSLDVDRMFVSDSCSRCCWPGNISVPSLSLVWSLSISKSVSRLSTDLQEKSVGKYRGWSWTSVRTSALQFSISAHQVSLHSSPYLYSSLMNCSSYQSGACSDLVLIPSMMNQNGKFENEPKEAAEKSDSVEERVSR